VEICYINDQFVNQTQAAISVSDRGLLLGDGLFETLRVFNGKATFLKEHWQRLINSAKLIHIPIPKTFSDAENIIHQLIESNCLKDRDSSIRITLTRGIGPRGISIPKQAKPTLIITIHPFSNPTLDGWSAYIASIKRNEHAITSKIKSLNYLDNILARMEANQNDATEALLTNTANHIVSASCANIFAVSDNILYTPPISDGVLPGITREQVLSLAEKSNIQTRITSITHDFLLKADEVFITNSLIGIKPIIMINGDSIKTGNPGDITCRLRTELRSLYNI